MSKKYVTSRHANTGQVVADRKNLDSSHDGIRGWQSRDARTGQFTIGPKGMSKLNAIEGIKQSASSRKMFADFDSRNMSPEERRRAIIARHKKG